MSIVRLQCSFGYTYPDRHGAGEGPDRWWEAQREVVQRPPPPPSPHHEYSSTCPVGDSCLRWNTKEASFGVNATLVVDGAASRSDQDCPGCGVGAPPACRPGQPRQGRLGATYPSPLCSRRREERARHTGPPHPPSVGRPPPPCATYPPCVAAEGEPQSPRSTPPPQPGNEDSNIYTRTITIDIGILLAHNPHGRGVVGRRHGRSAPRPPPPPSSPTHLGNTLRGWGQAFPEHTRRTYPILPRTSAHNIIAPTQHEPASQAQALAWR